MTNRAGEWFEILFDEQDRAVVEAHRWSVGYARRTFYARTDIKVDGVYRTERMHRMILSAGPDVHVDHANGDGLDNRRANIRTCTPSENARNSRPARTRANKGAYMFGARWRAMIRFERKLISLGVFDSETEAAAAYDSAAERLFGQFARTNRSVASAATV